MSILIDTLFPCALLAACLLSVLLRKKGNTGGRGGEKAVVDLAGSTAAQKVLSQLEKKGSSGGGDETAVVDLGEARGTTTFRGGSVSSNPFAPTQQYAKKAAYEKDHNRIGGERFTDGYDTGRTYPKVPTPSVWHE